MDNSKLFRKPLQKDDLTWVDIKTIHEVPSPNAQYKIVFSHFHEGTMGSYECLFNLLDYRDNIIETFEPLKGISDKNCCWTEDSTYFALSVKNEMNYGYLLVQMPSLNFSFIKIVNPYPLDISFLNDLFVISYNEQQLEASNSDKIFGSRTTELPIKKYGKPVNLEFNLTDLNFFPKLNLNNIESITVDQKEYKLELIDEGFKDFKGEYPQDTVKGYNGRAFEVYQLESFAEYGDDVSKYWLEEIKRKTNNDYNKWGKVYDYLGLRNRNEYKDTANTRLAKKPKSWFRKLFYRKN